LLMSTQITALTGAGSMSGPEAAANVYDDGNLRVEHDNYYVSLKGRALKLPRKEFLIISRLARNPERIVPSEAIWQHAWGHRAPFNAESLHVHIYRLRRRLEPFGLQIETMVNVGYRLVTAMHEGVVGNTR
jgi:DNA-binding response OmpR family regulator